MLRSHRARILAAAGFALALASARPALAAEAGAGTVLSKPADGGARPTEANPHAAAGPLDAEDGELPPGHPATGESLPPGHPAPTKDPHAVGNNGMPQVPEDTSEDTPAVPAGSIVVEIRDANDVPMPGTLVNLGIIRQSIAEGDSREHVTGTTNEKGLVTFVGRAMGTAFSYRVSVLREGATFAAAPFRLGDQVGNRTVLHVYPVTRSIDQAVIAMQATVYAEVKDDRIQFQQAFDIFNLGKTAWVPDGVVITLPKGFTALTANDQMSDVGIEPTEKGARLVGTFGPGRHSVEFRWQLPHSGDPDVIAEVGVAPNIAAARIMAPAGDIHLSVPGFPAPTVRTDGQGQRILVTEREFRRTDTPLTSVRVELHDLPTVGPARNIAAALAALTILGGIAFAAYGAGAAGKGRSREEERRDLLDELVALEKAFAAGDIGPKTHERARRILLDSIARTLMEIPPLDGAPQNAPST